MHSFSRGGDMLFELDKTKLNLEWAEEEDHGV